MTYAFIESDTDSTTYFSALDFTAGTIAAPTAFTGTGFDSGFILGADFDASGTLWFIYGNNNRQIYELSSVGAPATWATTDRTYVADAASNLADYPLSELALATGPSVEPAALADTGSEVPVALLFVGTVAILVGVVTVETVSRKRRVA